MSIWDAIRSLFAGGTKAGADEGHALNAGGTLSVGELARRLGVSEAELRQLIPAYNRFQIPKRAGGYRTIFEPLGELKSLQRRALRSLLKRLRAHAAAHGFERGRSIVTGALPHAGRAIVLRMDIKEFFTSTRQARVENYFRGTGWNAEAAALLTRLLTHEGSLPQGAPTSPRLSNLVNFRLDARLDALARKHGARYTRYADDMTFSFDADDAASVRLVVRVAKRILREEGYELHERRKLRVLRRHARQKITGLVVNEGVRLPRETRRWLRAVEHHARERRALTLTPAQLEGWRAFQKMIAEQSKGEAAH